MEEMNSSPQQDAPDMAPVGPFRRAVLRGLAVLLPPLLTIVIFVWVANTVADYLLVPLENFAKSRIAWAIKDVQEFSPAELAELPVSANGEVVYEGKTYRRVFDDEYIPTHVYLTVRTAKGVSAMGADPIEIYENYVKIEYLQWYVVLPLFLSVFLLVLYLLGKFLAAGIGRFFWVSFERLIHRLPLIRNVYSSVKQVTDFMLSEGDMEYTRVVAVEYPRRGMWSLGFVTGESMLDIRSAANEQVLSVLIPTSPAPFTGFTVTVKKSETVDLNITVDQAFQFIVSCGVVIPAQQLQKIVDAEAHSPHEQDGASQATALPAASRGEL
jgi:uncharacterized membrane protein